MIHKRLRRTASATASSGAIDERLDDAQHDRQVARVLRDLAAARARLPSAAARGTGNTTVINCRMIDEVMYGMMPSAKIVSRRKLPPLKRSKMPSSEPGAWLKS